MKARVDIQYMGQSSFAIDSHRDLDHVIEILKMLQALIAQDDYPTVVGKSDYEFGDKAWGHKL